MDFGDILSQWERRNRQASPRRAAAQAIKPPDPLERWLRENGVIDKDAETASVAAISGSAAAERRQRLLRKAPDAQIDLHSLTQDEAWAALDGFFRAGRQRGLEKLLLIHGKGNHSPGDAVLKDLCRRFIERCPFAGESGHLPAAQGGSGATWVLLKPAAGL